MLSGKFITTLFFFSLVFVGFFCNAQQRIETDIQYGIGSFILGTPKDSFPSSLRLEKRGADSLNGKKQYHFQAMQFPKNPMAVSGVKFPGVMMLFNIDSLLSTLMLHNFYDTTNSKKPIKAGKKDFRKLFRYLNYKWQIKGEQKNYFNYLKYRSGKSIGYEWYSNNTVMMLIFFENPFEQRSGIEIRLQYQLYH